MDARCLGGCFCCISLCFFITYDQVSLALWSIIRQLFRMFVQKLSVFVGSVAGRRVIIPESFIKTPNCLARTHITGKLPQAKKVNNIIERRTIAVKPTELESKIKMEWPKMTLFGDSITRRSFDVENGCWGSMIAFKVGNYFDVDSRGFEGYNSRHALELMPKLFPKSYLDKVEIFTLFFGHNDSLPLPMYVPLDQYEQNTRSIVKYLLENGLSKEKIILLTPTWYHHETFIQFLKQINMPPAAKSLEDAKRYSDVILSIGKDNDISVLDFFDITAKYQPLAQLFCDGIHLSQTGAKLLFDNLMPIIEKKIETRFEKPLADLWHVIPFDQRPDFVQKIAACRKAYGDGSAS